MITIDINSCIGCGACAADCFPGVIAVENGIAKARDTHCMECGHCVAVCPVNAITLVNYPMEEVLEFADIDRTMDANVYLNHLKGRRSIRRFKPTRVSEEQLQMILEAGRYSPTGSNMQNVSYTVVQNDIANFRDMVYSQMYSSAVVAKAASGLIARFADMWIQMYGNYKETGEDRIFFDAGTVITVASNSPQSALIAASHMETMIYSLGLGMLWSGFTNTAIMASDKLKKYIELPEGYSVYAVLVIGEPDVEYVRTVPRKPAQVVRK